MDTKGLKTSSVVDINEVILLSQRGGSHFFNADTMRFFRSRASNDAILLDGVYYFVTSEQYQKSVYSHLLGERRYTARAFMPQTSTQECCHKDIGEFQQFSTARQAWAHIRAHIAEIQRMGTG